MRFFALFALVVSGQTHGGQGDNTRCPGEPVEDVWRALIRRTLPAYLCLGIRFCLPSQTLSRLPPGFLTVRDYRRTRQSPNRRCSCGSPLDAELRKRCTPCRSDNIARYLGTRPFLRSFFRSCSLTRFSNIFPASLAFAPSNDENENRDHDDDNDDDDENDPKKEQRGPVVLTTHCRWLCRFLPETLDGVSACALEGIFQDLDLRHDNSPVEPSSRKSIPRYSQGVPEFGVEKIFLGNEC